MRSVTPGLHNLLAEVSNSLNGPCCCSYGTALDLHKPLLNLPDLNHDRGVNAPSVISDRFGRPVTNARISLNSSSTCNFRCIHCHMEGIKSAPSTLMTGDEIQRVVRILSHFGIEAVKLTGGEPMLRQDILEIAGPLHDVGLSRVNISLHSLHKNRFQLIAGVDGYREAISAVSAALAAKLLPVKLNMTLMKGVNDDEIEHMIRFVHRLGGNGEVVLQLIELVETDPEFYDKYHCDLAPIEERLKSHAIAVYRRGMHNRPRYILSDGVTVEVVRPMHNSEFCMKNNRIRITHDGKFKPCLLRDDNHIDFLTSMRAGGSDEAIAELFKRAVRLREPFFKNQELSVPALASSRSCFGACQD
jgi:cyclic pyranopterin phosphate synthase